MQSRLNTQTFLFGTQPELSIETDYADNKYCLHWYKSKMRKGRNLEIMVFLAKWMLSAFLFFRYFHFITEIKIWNFYIKFTTIELTTHIHNANPSNHFL